MGLSRYNFTVSKVSTQVVTPKNSCLYTLKGCMGGGFSRVGGVGARGVPRDEWGAVAAQEPALNELRRLTPFK